MKEIDLRRLSAPLIFFVIAIVVGAPGCKTGTQGVVESKERENRTGSVLDQTQPYIAIDDVNVRTGPGTQYPIITTVKKGTRVNVLVQENDWVQVVSRFGRPPGYIHERYVRPVEERAVSNAGSSYLTTQDTAVRQGPGPGYKVVAQIPRGTRVRVVGSEGEWFRVESKHGKPPGFIPMRDAQPHTGS
jgi:uncharacterized protein YgiM (DUF1202 family)